MTSRCLVAFVVWLGFASPHEVRADFESAWDAYQRGQYNFAVREFLWCAEEGHPLCQLYLADIYYYGHGTVVRRDKAVDWYLKSARQKNPTAAYSLFVVYSRTLSVPGNSVKAYMWLKIAKVLGKGISLKREAQLVATLTIAEIDEAQGLAAEWWIKYQ